MKIDIERLTPRFLYHDRNGYALCKAIERAFQMVADASEQGIGLMLDPYQMPEWRLDEMAWELNCLYDLNASLESKRYWIANAMYLYTVFGTPSAIYHFMRGVFEDVNVHEFWEYDGEPFHFRIRIKSGWFELQLDRWIRQTLDFVKNVRSVLDGIDYYMEASPAPAGMATLAGCVARSDRANMALLQLHDTGQTVPAAGNRLTSVYALVGRATTALAGILHGESQMATAHLAAQIYATSAAMTAALAKP